LTASFSVDPAPGSAPLVPPQPTLSDNLDAARAALNPWLLTHRRELEAFRNGVARFMLSYQFGIDEMMTKINILKAEFAHLHDYCPIEHVASRVKSPESILTKALRDNVPLDFDSLSARILDIAGIRVMCSFVSDVYHIADLLQAQRDVTVIKVKDYIAHPKPNGYRSLHLLVTVPVFLSESVENIPVEIQIRTIAMDFWASLEHKIYYKFDEVVPPELLDQLLEAAELANQLDKRMERLHAAVHPERATPPDPATERPNPDHT
jgi:putative GTP pyrophosphokinase